MLVNPWSIALLICSAASLFVVAVTVKTSIKVITAWDTADDSSRQIQLETKTWLSALLVEYAMVLQVISVFLLILAADNFSHILVGAMCATGAFLANPFGIPTLLIKLAGLFLCGCWIVLHRLDISSEYSPLMRFKFFFLLAVAPVFLLDTVLLFNYLARLEPDIITSCCGVVFSNTTGDGKNLIGPMSKSFLILPLYGLATLIISGGVFFLKHVDNKNDTTVKWIGPLFSILCICFFLLSLVTITVTISPYIYALPSHRCPFDILQKEYYCIGYPIYLLLLISTFSGIVSGLVIVFRNYPGLQQSVATFQKRALFLMLFSLPLFLLVVSWYPLMYLIFGGEW